MFGSRKEVPVEASLEQIGTIIGPGAIIEGPLTTKDSTRIDGTVKGNVTISGALVVGQEAKVYGTISAMNVYVAGEVNGSITAPQGKVEISDTGSVIGDIACKGIIIDENAVFQGKCDMTGADKSSASIAKERAASDKEASEKESENKEETKSENKDEHNNNNNNNKNHSKK